MSLYDHYIGYRKAGFAAIPCGQDKKPFVRWQEFQERMPTDDEVMSWCRNYPYSNMAIVMGRSGHVAIDIDGDIKLAYAALTERGITFPKDAPVQKTGKGHHVLLSVPQPLGDAVAWMAGDGPAGERWQIDVKGVGYIIVAPSIHANGHKYKWLRPLSLPIPQAPEPLVMLLTKGSTNGYLAGGQGLYAPPVRENWIVDLLVNGAPQGQRNAEGVRLAGYFFSVLPGDIARAVMHLFGERCTPPLQMYEVAAMCDYAQRQRKGR